MDYSSHKTILRSSSIMGIAQAASISSNLLKMKIIAVLLGPVGVGLVGLYLAVLQTASAVGTLGLDNAGTRQIAGAQEKQDSTIVSQIRQTLVWIITILAIISAFAFWLASDWIAAHTLCDVGSESDVVWLALGVGLTVAAASQTATLTGLRKIGYLAALRAGAGVAAAILGVASVLLAGIDGVIFVVLVVPVTTWILGIVFVRRLKLDRPLATNPTRLFKETKTLLRLGFAIMISALVTVAGQLVVRLLVQDEIGTEGLGHFQASWTISVTYVGFLLGALGTDYFPRMAAVIDQQDQAKKLLNDQTEITLLISGPIMLATIGLAPWIVSLLYSDAFGPSADILRWQILGDLLKVMSWPLAFIILARGFGKVFAFAELTGMSIFIGGTALLLPTLGLQAVGISFLAMYLIYLPLVGAVCFFGSKLVWSRDVLVLAIGLCVATGVVFLVSQRSDFVGAAVGVTFALLLGVITARRIMTIMATTSRFARLSTVTKRFEDRKEK